METRKSISGSWIVDEISRLNISSIPESWYKVIRQKKTPHAMAILILWDLLYWYKWTEVRNEETGLIIGYKKKFKADLLQRSYSAIAEKFGISKTNAADIIYFLEQLGVLKREFRTVPIGDTKMCNVLFIALNPSKIKEISEITVNDFCSEESENSTPMESELHTYGEKTPEVWRNFSIPMEKFLQTNTIITQSNSQSNSHTHIRACDEREAETNENMSVGDLQRQVFSLITEHNRKSPLGKKIPISANVISFAQKEAREMVEVLRGEKPNDIKKALENFISVAESDTWRKSFTWRSFLRNYREFTDEYFSPSAYLKETDSDDDPMKTPEYLFIQRMKGNPRFNVRAFIHVQKQWLALGQPEGEEYFKLQDEWEAKNAAKTD